MKKQPASHRPRDPQAVPAKAEQRAPSGGETERGAPLPEAAGRPEIEGCELLRILGHTAHGETWLARKPGLRLLAVTVLHRAAFPDDASFLRADKTLREYQPASRADGQSLEMLETGRAAEFLYYVMPLGDDLPMRRPLDPASPPAAIADYVPRTLAATLERSGAMPADEILRIGSDLTAALETLHRLGRRHGAVRPTRILFVNGDPKLREPSFADAGKDAPPDEADAYRAPEGAGSPQADIYSLGRVLAELVARSEAAETGEAGRRPGGAAQKAVHPGWRKILAKACAVEPTRRYQTAQDFHDELARMASGTTGWSFPKIAALAALFLAVCFGIAHFLHRPGPVPEVAGTGPTVATEEPAKAPARDAAIPIPAPVEVAAVPEIPPPAPLPPIAVGPAETAPAPVPMLAAVEKTPRPPAPAPLPKGEPATALPAAALTPPETPAAPVIAMRTSVATAPAAPVAAPVAPAPRPASGGLWTNSLGMKFAPVGTLQFCIWPTRVQDYEAYAKATGQPRKRALYEASDSHPVVQVSWHDAKAFCEWLTQKETGEGSLPAGQRYRLPTDLEWSQAIGLPAEKGKTPEARDGGIKDIYPWGRTWPPPRGAGNFADSSMKEKGARTIPGYSDGFPHTAPVGSFQANALGLYDMSGNVWQWCEDTYGAHGTHRVTRGGSWADDRAPELLSSYRNNSSPDTRGLIYGFRCVLAESP